MTAKEMSTTNRAQHQWERIYRHLGITSVPVGEHGPCPLCQAPSGFVLINRVRGKWQCGSCGASGAGVGLVAQVLGIKQSEASERISVALDALGVSRYAGNTEQADQEGAASLAQVRHFFTAHQFSRFADWHDSHHRPGNMVGYRRVDADGVTFTVLPDGWKEICKGRNPEKVARLCADAGWMSTPGGGRYQTLLRLPGGTNPALVYQFTMAMLGEEANQEEDLGRPRPVIALVK